MRTNMNFWPAKRVLCLALCILMLVGIAMPSFDTVAGNGRKSILGRVFGVTEALAAPADGATIDESGTYGTCSYDIYSDGTMVIRPTSGTIGTWGTFDEDGNIPWSGNSAITAIEFRGTIRPTSCEALFSQLSNLSNIDFAGFDTSQVTNMRSMFNNCSSLASLDISGLDTSKVTDMSSMFYGCSSLPAGGLDPGFELNLINFDTSNVTNMANMFANCSGLYYLDVSGFNTSNVTDMSHLFDGCENAWLGGFENWDTGKVTDMSYMFNDCVNFSDFDFSNFDTKNVTNMSYMFQSCYSLKSLDLSGWDTSNVTDMSYMFSSCDFKSLDVSNFDTSSVVNMANMFAGCSYLTNLDVSNFDTSNVANMSYMFRGCSKLTSLALSNFDTSNVTDMHGMFSNVQMITELDLSNFDTSNVTDMGGMFWYCQALTSLDISGWDTSSVSTMYGMLTYCNKLRSVCLGNSFRTDGDGSINSYYDRFLLPTPPSATTTGKWICEEDDLGITAKTPFEIAAAGVVEPGTWVWQMKPTEYTVIYHYNNGTGNTYTEKYVAAEDVTLRSTHPARFNMILTSWNTVEDGTGTSYDLGATIPANTYAAGDTVDLYAIWEDVQNVIKIADGLYQIQIPGNAQIKLDGIPAGTFYRVSEMLPNGWILLNQSNSSGSIGPLTNSVSTFINKYMPESASAAIYATKTMDGALATEDMAFEFTLKEGENVIQTVTAANGAVLFDPIIYTSAGTHVYTIVENWETYSGPLDASGVTFDTHVETVTVEVSDNGGGKLSAEVTYDADGPAFANRTNPGDLIITKNVVGQTAANADDTFTFTIRIKSPTGGDINSASIEIGKLPTAEQSPEPTP